MELSIDDVVSARKGSKDAFVRLIRGSEMSMYRVAKSILQSDAECADAIQETILKAYRSMGTLNKPEFFKTWLIRILINECKKILNQKKRVIPMETIKEEYVREPDTLKALDLEEAIDSLEEELRVIVTLFYFEDLPIKEITNMFHIPEGTVKSRLYRAREKLSHLLNQIEERRTLCYE